MAPKNTTDTAAPAEDVKPDAAAPVADAPSAAATNMVVVTNDSDKEEWVEVAGADQKNVRIHTLANKINIALGDDVTKLAGIPVKDQKTVVIEDAGVKVWALLQAKASLLVIRGQGKVEVR